MQLDNTYDTEQGMVEVEYGIGLRIFLEKIEMTRSHTSDHPD